MTPSFQSFKGAILTGQQIKQRVDAALGKIECDLVIRNCTYLNVFTCEWTTGELAIIDGTIVATENGLRGRRYFDAKGKAIVPGFVDAHVHVESSLMTPKNFEDAVLSRGTTTAICDPHEIANVMGLPGIQYFLDSAETLNMDLWVMLSSCVPATHMETNGAGTITAEQLLPLIRHPRQLGLAEMMNTPGVLHGDPEVLAKLEAFSHSIIDGHCPTLKGRELSAYASAGISSCHESSELEEGREKLRKGIAVWIREGSVAKDVEALAPLLSLATSTSVGFCTDDRNPLDIGQQGHIDYLVREVIRLGVRSEVAYRAASWSPARHYGLNRGPWKVGAIAPGYRADLVILDDPETCSVGSVLKDGTWVTELDRPRFSSDGNKSVAPPNTILARIPEARDFEGPPGRVHVIGVIEGKILTDHHVMPHDSPGVSRLSVLERYGKGSKPANGYVMGFGKLSGAIASSVGHDSHNLIVVGDRTEDMRVALAALAESGGGFCVVKNGTVFARLALPFGGLMSDLSPARLRVELLKLKEASKSIGCVLPEPFLQLAFLSLPVIPSLKLTDKGLVDVKAFQIIPVSAG